MFENLNLGSSLSDEVFDAWLETGRKRKMGYEYLGILWDDLSEEFRPVYLKSRKALNERMSHKNAISGQRMLAAYDLYSEAKVF
ncbi:MAG: hypothetical protein AAF789_04915 [Bacteroidota bacterium]